jgi:meiotically up-regulated gene 157 (Mug157) protein
MKNKVIAYEFDTKGNYILYEEPAGSLRLLEYYGFVDKDIKDYYENTLKWSFSKDNPYFYTDKITESGCEHAKFPWPLSAANSLFTKNYKKFGVDFFNNCIMDNYYAAESIDNKTGLVKTGNAFATCAGFIVYAIKMAIKP